MAGRWEDEFAIVYDACAQLPSGPSPREVDALAMWEVGAILGANRPPSDADDGLTPGQRRAIALERERPEWMDDEPLTHAEAQMMMAGVVN